MQNQSLKNVQSNIETTNRFQETIDECKKILNQDLNYFLKSKSIADLLQSYMGGHQFYRELPKIEGFVFLNGSTTLKLHVEVNSIRHTLEFNRSVI